MNAQPFTGFLCEYGEPNPCNKPAIYELKFIDEDQEMLYPETYNTFRCELHMDDSDTYNYDIVKLPPVNLKGAE